MKVELEFPSKFDDPTRVVLEQLRITNNNPDLTLYDVLLMVCKQYIAQEHAKYLVE